MIDIPLNQARFSGETELLEAIHKDDTLVSQMTASSFSKEQRKLRKLFRSNAVRVNPKLLPKLNASIGTLKERAGLVSDVEADVCRLRHSGICNGW